MKPRENRLVVADSGWAEDIPEWILEAIKSERIIGNMCNLIKPGSYVVGDAEIVAYLFTACLRHPIDRNSSEIYIWLCGNLMKKIKKIKEENLPDFIASFNFLFDKIKSVTNEDEQEKTRKRLEEGKLSLEDVIEQVKSMNQLGGFEKIKGMIPGLGNAKLPENLLENQQTKIAKWEHIIKSMTPQEKDNPEILEKQTSRIARIAKGAGVNGSDVRSLLKQYKMLNEMIKGGMSDMDMSKGMNQKQLMKMAKKFMKGGKFKI